MRSNQRDLDTLYRDYLANEMQRLQALHDLVCQRIAQRGEAPEERISAEKPNGASFGHRQNGKPLSATARVVAAIADAGEPLLSSQIKALVPDMPSPTVRSALFVETREGRLIKTGRRPFRWSVPTQGEGHDDT